jgi:ATP-dependent exoDNAse (exonuclease V) beta subunit
MTSTLLEHKNGHERDSRVSFDVKHHKYSVDGMDDYISVTTIIKEFFPKFDSDHIINKMMKGANWKDSKYFGMTKPEIQKLWSDKAESAASLGTLLHNTIENHYNGVNFSVDPSIEKGFAQFMEFEKHRLANTGLEPYRTEWIVFYEDFHIAGSIDMVFIDPNTGDLHIYDWKRTAELKKSNPYQSGFPPVHRLEDCKYNHYSLQLNIYKFILEQKYGKKVQSLTLVVLHPDNEEFILEPVRDLQKEVGELLQFAVEKKLYLAK